MVAGTPVVVVPRVDGGALVVVVAGAWVVVVSCWVVVVTASVVVVSGAGGTVVPEPVERGAVVFTTGAREVVAVVSAEPDGRVVTDVSGTVDELDDGADDEVGARVVGVVVVGRMVVVVGAWVATCCLGELSVPVATSNSRATRAIDART